MEWLVMRVAIGSGAMEEFDGALARLIALTDVVDGLQAHGFGSLLVSHHPNFYGPYEAFGDQEPNIRLEVLIQRRTFHRLQ